MSPYQTKIKELSPASDPRHVEGYMRLAHGTLDQLSHSNSARKSLWRLLASQKAASTRPRSSHNPTAVALRRCTQHLRFFTQTQFGLLVAKYNATGPIDFIQGCFRFAKPGVEFAKRTAPARQFARLKMRVRAKSREACVPMSGKPA